MYKIQYNLLIYNGANCLTAGSDTQIRDDTVSTGHHESGISVHLKMSESINKNAMFQCHTH